MWKRSESSKTLWGKKKISASEKAEPGSPHAHLLTSSSCRDHPDSMALPGLWRFRTRSTIRGILRPGGGLELFLLSLGLFLSSLFNVPAHVALLPVSQGRCHWGYTGAMTVCAWSVRACSLWWLVYFPAEYCIVQIVIQLVGLLL